MSDCSQPSSVSGLVGAGRGIRRSRAGRQRALQLTQVAAQGLQQRMARPPAGWCRRARHRAADAGERLPQRVAGVRQPQVQVVMGGQRVEQLDVGARQPGVPEQRQPRRQVGRAFAQPGNGLLRAGRAADRRGRGRPAPATVPAARPGRCRGRPGCRPASRPAAADAAWRRRRTARPAGAPPNSGDPGAARPRPRSSEVAQMRCQRAAPRLIQRAVDDLQQRPRHGLGRPRIVVDGAGDLGDQRAADCGTTPPRTRRRRGRACARAHAKAAGSASVPRRAPAPVPAPRRTGRAAGRPAGRRARRPADRCARHGADEAPSQATIDRRRRAARGG